MDYYRIANYQLGRYNSMSGNGYSINHDLTEDQLQELAEAIYAVKRAYGWTPAEARTFAQDITQGTFRNLLTFDSVKQWVVQQAIKAQKGFR
jgi:hypothetical protein